MAFLNTSTRFTANDQIIEFGPGQVQVLLSPDGKAYIKTADVDKSIDSDGKVFNIDNTGAPRLDPDWQYIEVTLKQKRTITIPATHEVVKEDIVDGDITDFSQPVINLDGSFREWTEFSQEILPQQENIEEAPTQETIEEAPAADTDTINTEEEVNTTEEVIEGTEEVAQIAPTPEATTEVVEGEVKATETDNNGTL